MNKLEYERERTAFGDALRTLRKGRPITGVRLAEETGISQSKLSKIETGALVPSTDDLVRIFAILAPSATQARNLTEWAQVLRTEFVSWRFGHHRGFGAKQTEVARLENQARRIRMLQIAAIPGLLQTFEYATRVMALSNVSHQADLEKAIEIRMQRQRILYEPGRQFEFLITETAALSRFCDPLVVARQLNRLQLLFDIPSIRVGLIANNAPLSRIATNSFVIYDSTLVVVETLAGEFNTTDERDIAMYNTVFDEFATVAAFGENAEPLILKYKQFLGSVNTKSRPSGKRRLSSTVYSG